MSISRLFYSPDDAARAVTELTEAGFAPAMVHSIAATTPPVSAKRLESMGVMPERAKLFAADIANGATLLLVEAPLGSAAIAIDILSAISPSNSGEPLVHSEAVQWDDTTPISSALGMSPVINNPTPLSSFFGWPVLSRMMPKEKWFGLPLLLRAHSLPLLLGMPLLLKDGKTLSEMFGWPTISKSRR